MTDTSTPQPIEEMGYEQARDELIAVVRRLEAGGSTLEESLALWERGEQLAAVCRRRLEGARARLDAVLAEDAAGEDGEEGPEESGEVGEDDELGGEGRA
ncbi:exodeoxyribonuclease VII small subunit [Streptomyces macrosporus]|uniref:Exodeoxyribonuclease 7 small subunit n=1 Tax=Streptomyces macrosporus TaxID=44032 RepID=A0ABN3K9P7_9ACTN